MRALALLFLASFSSTPAVADPLSREVSLREACRRDIAGNYMRMYDDLRIRKEHLRLLSDRLSGSEKLLAKHQEDIRKERSAMKDDEFDVAREEKITQLQVLANTLEERISEIKNMFADESSQLGAVETRFDGYSAQIHNLFKIEHVTDGTERGYAFRIDFAAPCPRFRALCPLPQADVARVRSLKIDGDLIPNCMKYSMLK